MTRGRRRGAVVHRVDEAADKKLPHVWAVGPWDMREFRSVAAVLQSSCHWSPFDDLRGVFSRLGVQSAPHYAVLAEPRPGVYGQAEVDQLIARAPLAEVVAAAGVWCEGELRTGRPLAGVRRMYWSQVAAWWRERSRDERPTVAPHWAGDGAWSHGLLRRESAGALRNAAIAVDAQDFSVFETLAFCLKPLVRDCIWTPRGRGTAGDATHGIWDGGQLEGDDIASLATFCGRVARGAGNVVALVDFPRPEHLEAIAAAGAHALLGKPYRLATLVDELADRSSDWRAVRGADTTLTPNR